MVSIVQTWQSYGTESSTEIQKSCQPTRLLGCTIIPSNGKNIGSCFAASTPWPSVCQKALSTKEWTWHISCPNPQLFVATDQESFRGTIWHQHFLQWQCASSPTYLELLENSALEWFQDCHQKHAGSYFLGTWVALTGTCGCYVQIDIHPWFRWTQLVFRSWDPEWQHNSTSAIWRPSCTRIIGKVESKRVCKCCCCHCTWWTYNQ